MTDALGYHDEGAGRTPGVFQLPKPDYSPLPNYTRAHLDWTGMKWTEREWFKASKTLGEIVDEGEVELPEKVADRGELRP